MPSLQAPQATLAEQTKQHSWARKIFVEPIKDVRAFFNEAAKIHGVMFMVIIACTYFLQGFRNYAFGGAISWYLRNLGLTSGQITIFRSNILLTWNIKFVYGLVFDNFPIFSRKYKPYYIFSALLGVSAALCLGIRSIASTVSAAVALLFICLMAMAMCDVIADGLVVKRAREAGARGGAQLQTFCWIMLQTGYLIGLPVSGNIVGDDGSGGRVNNLFLWVYLPVAIALFVTAIFIEEEKGSAKWTPMLLVNNLIRLLKAVFLNRVVFLPILFIFIRGVLNVDISDAYSFWLRDRPDGGEVIGANVQANIGVVGACFSILGLLMYVKFFTNTPFRKIFFWAQVIMGTLGFLDVALYKRWNKAIGIPDVVFLLFDSAVSNTFNQLTSMPFLVMAAQLCPADIEASFYAGLTSVSNGGNNVATLWSGAMLIALGVDRVNPTTGARTYDIVRLEQAIWIRFGLGFAACLFVWMVPNSSSIDPYGEGAAEKQATLAEADAAEYLDDAIKKAEEAKDDVKKAEETKA